MRSLLPMSIWPQRSFSFVARGLFTSTAPGIPVLQGRQDVNQLSSRRIVASQVMSLASHSARAALPRVFASA